MKLINKLFNRFGYHKANDGNRNGQTINVRNFDAAKIGRLFNDWNPSRESLNTFLHRSLQKIRERSRDLGRNDDYMQSFLKKVKANVVGSQGFTFQSDVVDDNGRADQLANDAIEDAWKRWTHKKNCTVTGGSSWLEVQNLLLECSARDGEFLIRIVRGFDNEFGFSLQLMSIDCLDIEFSKTLDNGNTVVMGVERNQWKKPVAYWVTIDDPNDLWSNNYATSRRERIPADEIIHRFIPMDVNQIRGCPWAHTAMTRLKMLGAYEEATLVASRVGACQGGFLKRTADATGKFKGDGEDENGNTISEVEPGMIQQLDVGFEFQPYNPEHPQTQFGHYVKSILRGISSGLGVSYNSLANDLEGVNYSSIRAGLLDERDQWKVIQAWFISSTLHDVFTHWLEWSLGQGKIALPLRKRDKFNAPKFIGRRWPWVDPMKDIQANVLAIENGFATRSGVVVDQGGDFEELCRTQNKDREIAKSFGLEFGEKPAPTQGKAVSKDEEE